MRRTAAVFARRVKGIALLWALSLSAQPALAEEIILTPVRDNTLFENPAGGLSNGAGTYLFAGKTAGNSIRRALLKFDVAGSVPAGATITSARLALTMSKTTGGEVSIALHRVLADWGEGTSDADAQEGKGAAATAGDATWVYTFFDTGSWAAPGGDFAAEASATTPVGGNGPYTWESPQMAVDAQNWLADPANNFGWVLIGGEDAASTAKRFASREHPEAANRPVLVLSYDATAVEERGWAAVKEGAR